MASFIEDLIRGAADTGVQMLDEKIKFDRQKELQDRQLENQKSMADYNAEISRRLDEAKQQLAERARQKKAADIQGEVGKIADQQAGQRFKTADESADTEGENYGNEVQRANGFIAQAQDEARKNFTPTGKDLVRASVNAGYEDPYKLATVETQEKAASSKAELNAAQLEFKYENMKRLAEQAKDNNNVKMMLAAVRAASGGGSGGEGGDTAKLKQAQTYMETVNKERAARGEQPITWEDAYNAANYAPKTSAEEKLAAKRFDIAAKLTMLGLEGEELDKKVDEAMRSAMSSKSEPKKGDKSGKQPQASAIPPQAIAALKKDPKRADEFDAKYGKDASKQYLGK